jgi:hypothetical protein
MVGIVDKPERGIDDVANTIEILPVDHRADVSRNG